MKLALVLLFTNELAWLKLHLPVFRNSFDGIVAITDPETTDGSIVYLLSLGAHVITRQWRYHWGEFATMAFNEAERLGYDAAMRMDPDECLMPDAGHEIKRLLTEEATLLVFPRYEFFGSRRTYRADMFPDHQARAWRLRRGITVQGARHEGIDFTFHRLYEGMPDPDYRVLRVKEPVIFHYGWCSPQAIWRNQVKYQMHAQIEAGGPSHVAFPPGTPLVNFPTVPFEGAQPIDPGVCGEFAPFEERETVSVDPLVVEVHLPAPTSENDNGED